MAQVAYTAQTSELTSIADSAESAPAEKAPQISQAVVQALVARAQQGDQDAYATLYNTYSKKIHSYLR